MKIIEHPTHEFIRHNPTENIASIIESARNCYQSESKGPLADMALLERLMMSGYPESPFEMGEMKVRFICDRGVANELVRHRIASYAQESTRYCNYSNDKFGSEITVVKPVRIHRDSMEYDIWVKQCESAEKAYFDLLEIGVAPQNARSVLPIGLKTSIDIKANLREWWHIFNLRDSRNAHPDIRYMMHGLLLDVANDYPVLFYDLMAERNREFVQDFVPSEKKGK